MLVLLHRRPRDSLVLIKSACKLIARSEGTGWVTNQVDKLLYRFVYAISFCQQTAGKHIYVLTVFTLFLFIIVKQFVILIWQIVWWIATRNKKPTRRTGKISIHLAGQNTVKIQICFQDWWTKYESLLKILRQSKSDI